MEPTLAVPKSGSPIPSELNLAKHDRYVPNDSTRRIRGAYFTPRSAADFMADWTVRQDGERILEPSFGDGIFLRAIARSIAERNHNGTRLLGVEIDEKAKAHAVHERWIADEDVRYEDFLGVSPFKVQAVIGNPPYVRLRHLPDDQRRRAVFAAETVMEQPIDPASSLWMPFVLHMMQFLEVGGRMALVLPYEFTYVRYARPLWKILRSKFGSLTVLRTHERLFPDLLQDVVILLADHYGSSTNVVRYQTFERVDELLSNRPGIDEFLDLDKLIWGERVFISALLGDELRHLLSSILATKTTQARTLVTFNIGYVAGDKHFFHPTDQEINEYHLPQDSLYPTLTSARMLKGAGLRTTSLSPSVQSKLFLPDAKALTEGERRYITFGEKSGVAARYKCQIREPWFVVPGTRIPDIVLSVFSERPALLINDAGCFASNSLLCGYNVSATSEEIATSWYTSLTLLYCELEVHALGGGVMVMVPNEAGNIRLPKCVQVQEEHLGTLDKLLRLGRITDAYLAGDNEVLIDQLGLHQEDVDLIRHGIDVLTHWRTSARTSKL